jgi:carboxypeptidase Q
MKNLALFLISMFALANASSQKEDSIFIRKISDHMLTNGQAYEDLRYLTKKIGGRLAGSKGMVLAENWSESVMKSLNPDRVVRQQCMVPHWVRGGNDLATAYFVSGKKSQSKKLDVVALGNSLGSMKPLKADVIEVKNYDDLEAKKDLVKGKIVFYNVHFNEKFVGTFNSYRDAVQYRGSGASRAAKYGASAVIVRSMSHSTDNNPHTGSLRYADSLPKIPAVAIGLMDADWLSTQVANGNTAVSVHTHGKFLPDTIGNNIIAELKGSEFPDEIITVGGHLDSWDNCEGAHDDGAGCVQTIEILRTFKALGYQPKRTIRFVMFANEENGLKGGNKYADEAKAKNEKHVFALESDAGGFTPRGFDITASPAQYDKIKSWKPILSDYGINDFTAGGGGADIGPLNRTFNTPMAGLRPDSQRYFDLHHARNDTFEAVNKRELLLGAISMAALVYLVDKYGL